MRELFFQGTLLFLMLLANTAIAASSTVPIPLTYFGLHIHRADQGTAWPNVPFGSWRLWDAYVTWADLEPVPGKWDFSRLDRYLVMARLTKVEVLLPLANTPTWAAARPSEASAYKPGNASEPANVDHWRRYVRTVGERYKGHIHDFEIWNEPNIKQHYTGSVEKLVELTCEASRILKSIDPLNRVVSPAATAGARGHVAYLDNFLALGGKDCIDIVAHHFYVPSAGPEAMVPLIREVRAVAKKNGVENKPIWNTETGWWLANGDGTPDPQMVTQGGWRKLSLEQESGEYLIHAFLLARAEGIDRFYWYAWDNQYGLGMIEPTSRKPKPLIEEWRNLVANLVGATGLRCNQRAKKWICIYVGGDTIERQISWSFE